MSLAVWRSLRAIRPSLATSRPSSTVDLGASLVGAAIAARWLQIGSPTSLDAVVLALVCVACGGATYVLRRRTSADLPHVIVFSGFVVACIAATGIVLAGDAGIADTAVRSWVTCAACLSAGRWVSSIGPSRVGSLRRGAASTLPRGRATLIVGPAGTSRFVAERLRCDTRLAIEPVGMLEDTATGMWYDNAIAGGSVPTLSAPEDVTDAVTVAGAEQVLIAFPGDYDERLTEVIHQCWKACVPVLVLAPLSDLRSRATQVASVGGLRLFSLQAPGAACWQRRTKYALDKVAAALALVVLAPLLLGIAAAIRLTMGAPVIFRQERVGEQGRTFTLLKFRTMTGSPRAAGEADAMWASSLLGEPVAPGEDEAAAVAPPRGTRLGTWLRRTALDELPQLINVLRGEMSLVGPRPERAHYVARFTEAIDRYADRHRVRCGLTGWAQVHGLRGETSLQDRVACDNYYIENWSPWLDVRILWRTLPALARASRPMDVDVEHGGDVAKLARPTRSQRFQRATRAGEHDRPVVVDDRREAHAVADG
jgi:exopolysaccharide biosynthesis polyprenyl glycosylphosphotransferase